MRRRKEATERVRSSCAAVAVVTVRRPRSFCSPPREGVGRGGSGALTAMTPAADARRAARRLPWRWAVVAVAARGLLGSGDRRGARLRRTLKAGAASVRLGERSPPARRRRASSSERRFGFGLAGEALLLLALARFGGGAFLALTLLAFGARLGVRHRAAAVFLLAGAGVGERAGAGLSLIVGQRAQHDAGADAWAAAGRAVSRAAAGGGGASGGGGAAGGAGAGGLAPALRLGLDPPGARRFTFSTTTTLERPWEKL